MGEAMLQVGVALQVRHVVVGSALPTLASGVDRWEPRVTPEPIDSAARIDMLQEKAAQAWPEPSLDPVITPDTARR